MKLCDNTNKNLMLRDAIREGALEALGTDRADVKDVRIKSLTGCESRRLGGVVHGLRRSKYARRVDARDTQRLVVVFQIDVENPDSAERVAVTIEGVNETSSTTRNNFETTVIKELSMGQVAVLDLTIMEPLERTSIASTEVGTTMASIESADSSAKSNDGSIVPFVAAGCGVIALLGILVACICIVRRRRSQGLSSSKESINLNAAGLTPSVDTPLESSEHSIGQDMSGHTVVNMSASSTSMLTNRNTSTASASTNIKRMSTEEIKEAPLVTFLSHGKAEGGATARLMKLMLEQLLKAHTLPGGSAQAADLPVTLNVFLDSDNLVSLSDLMNNIKQSMTVTLMLTQSTFYRPWCVCEIYTAFNSGMPIVPVEVLGHEFDTVAAKLDDFLKERIPSSGLGIIKKACPGFTIARYKQILLQILKLPRLKFTPTASAAVQWSESFDVAKAIKEQIDLVPYGERPVQFRERPFKVVADRPSAMDEREGMPSAYILVDKDAAHNASEENMCVAHILQLMLDVELEAKGRGYVAIDSDRFMTHAMQITSIEAVPNVVILLSENCLQRPWLITLLVKASKAGARLIPVQIEHTFDFARYLNPEFFTQLRSQFDEDALETFQENNISWSEVAVTIRILFDIISAPFTPHAALTMQYAQAHQVIGKMQISKPDMIEHEEWRRSFLNPTDQGMTDKLVQQVSGALLDNEPDAEPNMLLMTENMNKEVTPDSKCTVDLGAGSRGDPKDLRAVPTDQPTTNDFGAGMMLVAAPSKPPVPPNQQACVPLCCSSGTDIDPRVRWRL